VGDTGATDPNATSKRRRAGRRPWRDPRDVLNGILWILLRTVELPGRSSLEGPPRTLPTLPEACHRRFQKWIEEGVLDTVLEALALDLEERG
jgi:hypothetical protein